MVVEPSKTQEILPRICSKRKLDQLNVPEKPVKKRKKNVMKEKKTSLYIGVSWHKDNSKWCAYLNVNGKHTYAGSYTEEKDAGHAINLLCDNLGIPRKNPELGQVPERIKAVVDMLKAKRLRSSNFHGIYMRKGSSRWEAYIRVNEKTFYGGSYKKEEDAANIINVMCDEHAIPRKNPSLGDPSTRIKNAYDTRQRIAQKTSKFIGVRVKRNQKATKWEAGLQIKTKYHYGGTYEDESEAALAVNFLCDQAGLPRKNPKQGDPSAKIKEHFTAIEKRKRKQEKKLRKKKRKLKKREKKLAKQRKNLEKQNKLEKPKRKCNTISEEKDSIGSSLQEENEKLLKEIARLKEENSKLREQIQKRDRLAESEEVIKKDVVYIGSTSDAIQINRVKQEQEKESPILVQSPSNEHAKPSTTENQSRPSERRWFTEKVNGQQFMWQSEEERDAYSEVLETPFCPEHFKKLVQKYAEPESIELPVATRRNRGIRKAKNTRVERIESLRKRYDLAIDDKSKWILLIVYERWTFINIYYRGHEPWQIQDLTAKREMDDDEVSIIPFTLPRHLRGATVDLASNEIDLTVLPDSPLTPKELKRPKVRQRKRKRISFNRLKKEKLETE